jgi:2-amino-4-hydroxy-6-hydroxymethyldihydropteridine diphosphokinase
VTKIYLAFGSNLGDRKNNIERALAALAPEITIIKTSPFYETSPMYIEDQPTFLNIVSEAETDLAAEEVFQKIVMIQNNAAAHMHNMPRIIDVDLIFYGQEIISTADLIVPHPKMRERDFVLQPLFDIAPNLLDPVTGKRVQELLAEIPPHSRSVIRVV